MSQKKPRFSVAAILLTTIIWLDSCAPDPVAMQSQSSKEQPKVYSSEDRRIAKALSLGGGKMEDGGQSPVDEATACVVALEFIRERLSGSAKLNSESTKALEKVIKLYRDQAGANSMSPDQFAKKLKTAEIAMPEQADRARASLRCLQAFE